MKAVQRWIGEVAGQPRPFPFSMTVMTRGLYVPGRESNGEIALLLREN